MGRLVDISIPMQNDVASAPPGMTPEVTNRDHHETVHELLSFFPGGSTCSSEVSG